MHDQARRETTGGPWQSGHPEALPQPSGYGLSAKKSFIRNYSKAFKAFWGIVKNKAFTTWGLSEYEGLGQSAPPCSPSVRACAWLVKNTNLEIKHLHDEDNTAK